jgi:hypothetical protein
LQALLSGGEGFDCLASAIPKLHKQQMLAKLRKQQTLAKLHKQQVE